MKEYARMKKDLLAGNKDYVLESVSTSDRFYRSKDTKPKDSLIFGSYMMNKKWTLDEEFNNHILRFQQVNMSVI